MATDPRPCPISPCDWDLEGTLGDHLFTQHDEEELSAALVRALMDNDRLRADVAAERDRTAAVLALPDAASIELRLMDSERYHQAVGRADALAQVRRLLSAPAKTEG